MIDSFWKEFQNEMPEYSGVETPPSYYFCDNKKTLEWFTDSMGKNIGF